jgi:hypothetical protein
MLNIIAVICVFALLIVIAFFLLSKLSGKAAESEEYIEEDSDIEEPNEQVRETNPTQANNISTTNTSRTVATVIDRMFI